MLLGFYSQASAQLLREVPDMKGKMVYGGNFGFGMSGNYLSLSIAPQVGYRIFSPWEVGVRTIYDLSCWLYKNQPNEYVHFLGVGAYTNVQVYKGLFLHVEDEVMYGFSRYDHGTYGSQWYNTVFVGGGYRQYSSDNSFFYVMVLYNLSWSVFQSSVWGTPYDTPIALRVGYCLYF